MKKQSISIISFNAMSAFSFDSFHGFRASLNVFKRLQKTAEILTEKNPDIITLQEVHTYAVLTLLQSKLKSHPFVYYKKYIFGPRGGLVIFSKLALEDMKYINFKKRGTFLNTSFIAHITKNGVLYTRLKNKPLAILNTHMTPNLDHDHSKSNRFEKYIKAQLEQIVEVVKEIDKNKMDVLLAGDFNVAKNSYSYNQFVEFSKLHDVFHNYTTPTQHQEFLPSYKKVKRIDYIFIKGANSKPEVESTEQVFTKKTILKGGNLKYLSDHIGLSAQLHFDTL